jgi:chemotaxis protein MotB
VSVTASGATAAAAPKPPSGSERQPSALTATKPAPSSPALPNPAERAQQESQQLEAAAQQLREAVQKDPAVASLAQHVAIDVTPAGLRIQLLDTQNQSMFAFGSATPNDTARLLLARITPVLMRLPEQISIAGHTDAAPYQGAGMTNWELSTDRANAARRLLVAAGLPEQRLRDVAGHADHELLLPADPLAAANRRIAILVLRESPASAVRKEQASSR